MELRLIAHFAPAFVIAILFTSACIASGGLNVTVRDGTYPDVFVGWRDRERFDPPELVLVLDGFAVGIEIREVPASQLARNAGARVIDVA